MFWFKVRLGRIRQSHIFLFGFVASTPSPHFAQVHMNPAGDHLLKPIRGRIINPAQEWHLCAHAHQVKWALWSTAPGSGPRTLVGKHPISLTTIIGQTGMLIIVGISVKYKCTSFQSLAGAAVTQVRSVWGESPAPHSSCAFCRVTAPVGERASFWRRGRIAAVTFNFIQTVYKWLHLGGKNKSLWKKVFARLLLLLVWVHWHYLLPRLNDFPPSGATVRRASAVGLRIALDTRLSGHYTHCNMQLALLLHFHYTITH